MTRTGDYVSFKTEKGFGIGVIGRNILKEFVI